MSFTHAPKDGPDDAAVGCGSGNVGVDVDVDVDVDSDVDVDDDIDVDFDVEGEISSSWGSDRFVEASNTMLLGFISP